MTSQAVFSELGSGARFDYRRYGGQIRKLSSKSATSTSSASASMHAQGAAGALPSSLDFFGSMGNPVAGAAGKVGRGKKKKKNNRPGNKKTDTHQHQQMRKKTKMKDEAAAAVVANKTARRKRPRPVPSTDSRLSSDTSSASSSSDSSSSDASTSDSEDEDTNLFLKNINKGSKKSSSSAAIARGRALLQEAEQVRAFRKRLKIFVEGNDIADPLQSFDGIAELLPAQDAHLVDMLLQNIEASRYTEPTAVQMQAIPALIEERDVLAVAPTGSGKTAAFLIPILARLKVPKKNKNAKRVWSKGPRAIVVTPTRELAVQILREFQRLSKGKKFRAMVLSKANAGGKQGSGRRGTGADGACVSGGSQQSQQSRALAATDLIVTTPMRLVHLIRRGGIDVSGVESVVLDEADRLFEEGFLDQIDTILGACGKEVSAEDGIAGDEDGAGTGAYNNGEDGVRQQNPQQYTTVQRAMFSATMPQGIEEMIQTVLRDPVRVRIGSGSAAAQGADTIDQRLLFVGREEGKLLAVRQLVQSGIKPPIIMFVQSIARAQALFQELCYDGINVDVIHADRSQAQRDAIIRRFRTGEIWVLIATDLMARGMDFKGVNCVINYDFPQSVISYVHRIGRTGRAGRPGEAITFFTESDMTMLRSIANVMKLSGCDVPAWMLTMKKMRHSDKKRIKSIPVKRRPISTTAIYDKQKARRLQGAKESSRRAKGEGKEWVNKTERKKRRRMAGSGGGGSGDGGADGDGWTVVK